jgi:hypothetical protein
MLMILAGAALFRPHKMKAGPGSATTPKLTVSPAVIPGQKLHLAENYGKLPLGFEANQGQTDGRVKFLSRGRGYALFLTGDEVVLTLGRASQKANRKSQKAKVKAGVALTFRSHPELGEGSARVDVTPTLRSADAGLKSGTTTPVDKPTTDNGPRTTDAVLRMRLVGANASAAVTGADELPGKSNYFIGNDPKKWRTNVPNYAQVRYQDVYPGVDLVYYGNQGGQLEYDFVVAPGADPSAIKLDVGAVREPPTVAAVSDCRSAVGTPPLQKRAHRDAPLQITADGDLVVKTDGGQVRFQKPVVYQEQFTVDGSQLTVQGEKRNKTDNPKSRIQNRKFLGGQFVLQADNQVGFKVPSYDHTRPLVIDPVLSYSTYLGGNSAESGTGIAVDSSNNAYVTGYTSSTDFPTMDPYQGTNKAAPNQTVFVAKLNPAGSALVYSTYLGGSYNDESEAIAVDSSGNAYVTGFTGSADFPTVNPIQSTCYGCPGLGDAFVTELNPTGSGLVYSTYLGFSETEGDGIAVDSSGNAYVAGLTLSAVPTTANAYQKTFSGFEAAFVAKFSFNASSTPPLTLAYSTYLGCAPATPCGGDTDQGLAIAVNSSGNAYVTGATSSADFPTTPNAFQTTCGGCSAGKGSAYVTELSATGSDLIYSTFLGGSVGQYGDSGHGIAVDSSGNAYVTGGTYSTDFPTKNPIQATCASCSSGASDAFVAELNAGGTALVYSTYLGGNWFDWGYGIAVDSYGNAYVTGLTQSTNFPTWNWLQLGSGYCENAYVSELNFNASSSPPLTLVYSTYLGPVCNSSDVGLGIAVDSSANAYVTGWTGSGFPTVNPLQPTDNAINDTAFVAKLAPGTSAVGLSPSSLTFASQDVGTTSGPQVVTLTNTGNGTLVFSSTVASGSFAQTNDCGSPVAPGDTCTLSVTFSPTALGTNTGAITITDNASSTSPQTVALSGNGMRPVELVPTSVNFGNQGENSKSAAHTVTLNNPKNTALTIYSITTSGDFGETNTCGSSVPAHGKCTISVTFTPSILGGETGTLTVTDSADNSPQTASLSGTGVLPAAVSPTSLTFGTQKVGTSSTARKVTLINNLSTALAITITFTGANPGDFAETDTCGGSLAARSRCSISVTFTPGAAGTRSARLNVNDSANNSPQRVALTGTGK